MNDVANISAGGGTYRRRDRDSYLPDTSEANLDNKSHGGPPII